MPLHILILGSLFLLPACSQTPGPDASGQELYAFHCNKCHGETGMCKTFFGYPSLVNRALEPKMVKRIINKGSAERNNKHQHREEMPAFQDQLSKQQIDRIITHIGELRALRKAKK